MTADPETMHPDPTWYRDLVHSAEDYAIISMREDGKVFAWSPGASRLFQYTEAEAIGQSADLIFTPEDIRAEIPEKERAVAFKNGSSLDERWHVRKDGSRVWASGKLVCVTSDKGEIRGLVKIVQDRTKEKAVQDALMQTEERFRLLSRATNDVIWDWDLRTNTIKWNEATETHFGVPADCFANNIDEWKSRVHPNDRNRIMQSLAAAIESGGSTWSDRYQFLGKDGKYESYFDRGTISRDEQGRPLRMIGSMLNITNDRRAENLLREAQERIESQNVELEARVQQRTQELTAAINHLEEFSYSMSHDLKGPAHTMRALVEILRNEPPSPEECADILSRVHRNSVTLCVLINEMLRFSEIGLSTPKIVRVELDRLLRQVIAELQDERPAAPVGKIDVREPLGMALADQALLWHATRSLISNALKFVAPGVWPHVTIWTDQLDGRLRLHIKDNGIGIEPRFRDQIFELFRRLHHQKAYPGYGVGLATVKRAVEKMSGKVSFESVVDQGTVFTLDLPAPRGS